MEDFLRQPLFQRHDRHHSPMASAAVLWVVLPLIVDIVVVEVVDTVVIVDNRNTGRHRNKDSIAIVGDFRQS